MADFTVPGTWTHDGDTLNQSIYRVTGHTAQENYLVIFDRKLSVASNGSFSKPSYRIRIVRSFVDANSDPLSSKAVFDANISWPSDCDSSQITGVKAMLTLAGTIFGDVELASDIVDDQRIPRA